MRAAAAVAGVGIAAFLLLAAGFKFGATFYFWVADYMARRRETATQRKGM